MGTVSSTRSATGSRRLLALLVALALAFGGLGAVGVRPASAQDEVEQITQRDFDRLTRAAQDEVIFGPEDGGLDLDEPGGGIIEAGVEVESFYARAEFVNPSDGIDTPWDYGFTFRSQGRGEFLGLLLLSDGSWGVIGPEEFGEEGLITSGSVETVNGGEGASNVIDLYADGEVGHFGLNGDYVASFPLPVSGAGDIVIGSGFLNEEGIAGGETEFTGWIVWSLDEGGVGPDDETPDPDDEELSDDDLTATAEAEEEDEELSDDDLTATAEAEEDELSDDDLTATAEAEDERGTGGDPTYTSPTFGYTLSYDRPWELEDEVSDDDGDLLVLTTQASRLQIVGNETRDTPEECIDALIEDVEGDADVTEAEIAQDERDRDLRDDSDELSWVVLFFTLEGEGGEETELTGYYECRVIEEGESLLTVVHLAPSDDYNDEIENRTDVLDTIEIDGGSAQGDGDETPTEEPEEDPTEEATEAPDDEPTAEATAESELAEGSIVVFLEAVGDSELVPFGTIEPTGPNESQVFLFAVGADGALVTIHEGTCRAPGEAAFEVGEVDEAGLLDATIDVATEDIATGDFVMLLSTDGTDETALACGVLEPPVEE